MTAPREAIQLPLSCPPRGLTRLESSRYVGMSIRKFDEAVAKKIMPKPKNVLGVLLWDRLQLDAAFSALPTNNEAETESTEGQGRNPWDDR